MRFGPFDVVASEHVRAGTMVAIEGDGTLVLAPIDGSLAPIAVAIEDLDTPTVVLDLKRGWAMRP